MRFVFACFTVAILGLSLATNAETLSLDEAVALVRGEVEDRILRATPAAASDGRDVFLIRLYSNDGRMYTLEVDTNSGDMKEVATGPLVMPRGAPPPDESEPEKPAQQEQDPCAS